MSKCNLFILCIVFLGYSLVAQKANKLPNILWITYEDSSPNLSFYGDSTARTPHLDKIAKESIIFDNAYMTTPVCGPSRSAIITGMYPTSIGTMHMRAAKDIMSWSDGSYKDKIYDPTGKLVRDLKGHPIREYSAVIPAEVKCFTEYLRASGYYCTNNAKTDYQFAVPQSAWDENDNKAHWKNRPAGKPFFSIFNINHTHESRIWLNEKLPMTVSPTSVKIPPYFMDTEATRRDLARYYSNIEMVDREVGQLLNELKEAGLYDDTIIFIFSDHGGPLPLQKRELNDAGLKVPLLVRFPRASIKGRNKEMVSSIDLAPTILSLASINPPKYMEGRAFFGKYRGKSRDEVFANSDRFDEHTDRSRAVRTSKYLYVKNYYPNLPKYKDVAYRKSMGMMTEILKLNNQGTLSPTLKSWFQPKQVEELYDCDLDPYQLHNIAADPKYTVILSTLRKKITDQFESKLDLGAIPEVEMIKSMWLDNVQPSTSQVTFRSKKNLVCLSSITTGASISYLITKSTENIATDQSAKWQLYTKPLSVPKGYKVYGKSERIGYKSSKITIYEN